jgi:hypothetical protein
MITANHLSVARRIAITSIAVEKGGSVRPGGATLPANTELTFDPFAAIRAAPPQLLRRLLLELVYDLSGSGEVMLVYPQLRPRFSGWQVPGSTSEEFVFHLHVDACQLDEVTHMINQQGIGCAVDEFQ